MHQLGYVQNLDKAGIPNVEKNIRPDLKNVQFDPGRNYSVPWQSGMTGLIVNTQLAPNVHSINDLFDPQYKGKVEMLTELRDTVPLVMKADGIDPNKATQQQWLDTIDKLKSAVASGQIRRFTGNDYTRDMANGDVSAIIGWSGDAVQLQADNPNIQFRMPTEGCILWSDNMEIPVGAPNPTAAEAFMNYVYDPTHQAQIASYNSYVTPVDGVQDIFRTTNPDLVNDPLIFPTENFTKKCSTQPNLTGQEEQTVTRAFEGVLNS
jgi:spermidine/putrescine transport system substrate-binding protein